MALWYIFGNSPTFKQAILTVAISVLIGLSLKIGDFRARLKNAELRFGKFEESFIRLANDLKELKKV